MKSFLHTTVIAILALFISFASFAQCNFTAGGNGVSKFANTAITINGLTNDWAVFLADPDNNSYDNTNGVDLNAPIADAGRDLTRMAITSDLSNLYLYIERAGSSSNKVDILLYIDLNNNDVMEQGEPVFQFDWSGSNGTVNTSIHNYNPSSNPLLNSISQNIDGKSLWGTLTSRSSLGSTGKGTADGIAMEVRIPYSAITTVNAAGVAQQQLFAGQNFKFHLSSINGNVSSIPNQNSINDDLGGCIIAPPVAGSLPVSLIDFQVTLKDKSANLSWTTTNHYNFSHFVIEKSTDAVNFSEAAILFAPTTSSAENTFTYNDNLKNATAKTYYYRLRMTDTDGKYSYSETRMIRITAVTTASVISTFPNPMVNEVRVLIPENWQDKKVVYEIYNTTGVLLQRHIASKAAQIQQLNVQTLSSGTYVLRVSNGSETSTTKLIK